MYVTPNHIKELKENKKEIIKMEIQNDSKIFDLILEEESRQIHGIELIALR
jgi:hypothetical protein